MTEALTGILFMIILAGAVAVRFFLNKKEEQEPEGVCVGISQTTGRKEIQADAAYAAAGGAGMMLVLADGIGRENTGRVCAQLAADAVLDSFETYHELQNPEYFFRTAFMEANSRIQKTIGERRGGTSLAAVFCGREYVHYAMAGDIRIALVRNQEIIPLSKGQTTDVLAVQAYKEGRLSRQKTIWSMDEKRLWNYVGKDGFREIEICERPIRVKPGDSILMISRGIFEELSWSEMEDILFTQGTAQTLADRLTEAAKAKKNPEMDNGSVLLLNIKAEAADEKDKFRV